MVERLRMEDRLEVDRRRGERGGVGGGTREKVRNMGVGRVERRGGGGVSVICSRSIEV